MRKTTRMRVGGLAALMLAAGLTVAGTTTASAASVDGSDPQATGCANTAKTVSSAAIYDSGHTEIGYVELRYSTGCRTTWARVTSLIGYNSDRGISETTITRNSDGRSYTKTFSAYGQTSVYTPQVNDAGVTSYAYGEIDDGIHFDSARTASY